jgi:hypothetical protein
MSISHLWYALPSLFKSLTLQYLWVVSWKALPGESPGMATVGYLGHGTLPNTKIQTNFQGPANA